jgi:hypothetical protein
MDCKKKSTYIFLHIIAVCHLESAGNPRKKFWLIARTLIKVCFYEHYLWNKKEDYHSVVTYQFLDEESTAGMEFYWELLYKLID